MTVNSIERIVNALLKYLDLRITSTSSFDKYKVEQPDYRLKYREFINEVMELYNGLLYPLPPCEGRCELLSELFGTSVSEAMYIIYYLHKSLEFYGDVCEFGTAMGATSALLANEIRTTGKKLWLFDSFKGLSKPSENDNLIDDLASLGSMEKYEGFFSYSPIEVRKRLKAIYFPLSRVEIVDGFIEETINQPRLPLKVCFAYVDFDLYHPITVTLNYLKDHLSDNGFAVVDDYGFFSSGVKKAVDEFVEANSDSFEFTLPRKFAGKFCILAKKSK